MPRALSCPVCRITLPAGGTHCPRCGLRIAALPRRSKRVAAEVAAAAGDGSAAEDSGGPLAISRLQSVRLAVAWGLLAGVALAGVAAVIAALVSRGHDFGVALSNATVLAGGAAMVLAVVSGGVRVSRLLGDVELMRERALHGPRAYAHHHLRIWLAAAGVVPLAVGIALAVAVH